MSPRIGIISPYSLTVPGGVQSQVLGLARALRRRGIDTRVLGPCDGPPPDSGVTPLGNSLPTAANGSIAPLAPDLSAQLRVIRALNDERFDLIHLHEPLAPGPTMTATVVKMAPVIGTFHAAGGSQAYRWLRPGVRWLADHLDHRCAVSPEAAAMAEAALGGQYEVVDNAIEVPAFRDAVPVAADRPTIFFCGRHEPRKGLAVLLDAMAYLPDEVQLWVGSDGPDTELLRSGVNGSGRIDWLGRLSEREKAARLRGADVFCAPSLRSESFGIVLLEAMAAETPVVASHIAGYAKVARGGRDAVLVEPGDARALAAGLNAVLDDETCRQRLIVSGRERAGEYSMAKQAERYLDIYDRTLSRAARR